MSSATRGGLARGDKGFAELGEGEEGFGGAVGGDGVGVGEVGLEEEKVDWPAAARRRRSAAVRRAEAIWEWRWARRGGLTVDCGLAIADFGGAESWVRGEKS